MKYLFLLLFMPIISQAQQTYVPDDNFEAYLEANGMGNGIANDDYVTTANISGVWNLNVSSQNIADLTGIGDFSSLTNLVCFENQLTSLDLSSNVSLTSLLCFNNQLTSLDMSSNTSLINLDCAYNYLTSLDVSNNVSLNVLKCSMNQLKSLDVSNNISLTQLDCMYNELTCLNLSNGNNVNMTLFTALNNPDLTCITVDNPTWANTNWGNEVDQQTSFSQGCGNPCGVGISELLPNSKTVNKITDLMGRRTEDKPNTTLIYIYSDGTTEKVYRME